MREICESQSEVRRFLGACAFYHVHVQSHYICANGCANEIIVNLKDWSTSYKVWEKLRATYENCSLVNQVNLMKKLVLLTMTLFSKM